MTCRRCSGLMIQEEFRDFLDGKICFSGSRRLLCGAIEDPVILSNRQRQPKVRGTGPKARLGRNIAVVR